MDYKRLFKLEPQVQHYPWGARGRGAEKPYIAELEGLAAEKGQPFAELWIGAHPKLPSTVALEGGDGMPLDQFIGQDPRDILGASVVEKQGDRLPLLLKVLDCEKSLSIQAHPDKKLAEELHKHDPDNYPDANHKPEIAISIRGMDAFCGFRSIPEIIADIRRLDTLSKAFPDTSQAIGSESMISSRYADSGKDLQTSGDTARQWLRETYAEVFKISASRIKDILDDLKAELKSLKAPTKQDEWAIRLMAQHPGDRGILSAYFLNLIHLDKNEAVFLGPNKPHAYLHGTIIECMASSDNVVRAGLTSKFIDHTTLIDMLTYTDGIPPVFTGQILRPGERVYRVPAPEFQVEFYEHDSGYTAAYSSEGQASILFVLEGAAAFNAANETVIRAPRGSAWLWPAALGTCSCLYLKPGTTIVRARPAQV